MLDIVKESIFNKGKVYIWFDCFDLILLSLMRLSCNCLIGGLMLSLDCEIFLFEEKDFVEIIVMKIMDMFLFDENVWVKEENFW